VREVKIDRSFVMDMRSDGNSTSIVRSVVELGHSLGLQVIAEGVEDEDTWRLLQDMGCDLIQGYHVCRPVSGTDLTNWVASSNVEPPRAEARPRVLVVEDNPVYLKLVRMLLTTEKYEVVSAIDQASALEALQERSVDLILMDIVLPDGDGIELASQITSQSLAPGASILVLSGDLQPGDSERARLAGCQHCMRKPASTRELVNLIRGFVVQQSPAA
jgi:CheY-like chemotaxis protein